MSQKTFTIMLATRKKEYNIFEDTRTSILIYENVANNEYSLIKSVINIVSSKAIVTQPGTRDVRRQ